MSTSTLGLFLRQLALNEEVSRLGTTSDHTLLAAYESGRGQDALSQAAFTELMRRHGPMVLRTCRRILKRESDAEDAFQTTFIFLARQAGAISKRETLGGWLHRVAYRTTLKVLRGAVRRRAYERQASAKPHAEPNPVTKATWNEIWPILDAELDALPDEARRLLIACYLQEKSYSEVAAELGLPRSSVAWRLEKARGLLAARLARRGITVSSVLLAVVLGEAVKGAGIPAVLLVHTVEAARMFTGQATGIVSDHVAQLVKGGLAQMTQSWTHLSMMLAGWMSLLGAGLIACQTLKAWPDQTPEDKPPAAAEHVTQKAEKSSRTDCFGDPLPPESLARMGTTRLRHTSQVNRVLFAPDGRTLASAGMDGTVRLWDVATGKFVRSLKHPPGLGPYPVSFARDGKMLASAAINHNQFWLWDVRTGEQLRELKLNQKTYSLALSSDGKTAASGGMDDGIIRLWDVATENLLHVLQGHEKPITSLSFSADNKTLASVAEGDKVVRLWDVSSGKLLQKLEHPKGALTASFSLDGKTLASGGGGRTLELKSEGNPSAIRLWEVATGKLLRTLEGHHQIIISLSFSPDGKLLASGSRDCTIRLWDVIAGKELRKLKSLTHSASLSFSPDGKMLASGGTGPAVHLWDVTTGKEFHRPGEAHTGCVGSVSFSPDGRTLATAAALGEIDGMVRLWDSTSGKPLHGLEHPGGDGVIFSPDGKTLASGGADVVRIWDATTGKQLRQLRSPGGLPLVFSPDGKLLAAGSRDRGDLFNTNSSRTLRLWEAATGKQLRPLEHLYQTLSVAFSPDGKMLAVGTGGVGGDHIYRNVLYLWDAVTRKELWKVEKLNARALSFSPDGKTLVVWDNDQILLVEVSTGKVLRTLTDHQLVQIRAVAFSPSGRLLATAGSDQMVRLWEVNAGLVAPCHLFRGHDGEVTAVAFSPDGRRLASGSNDSTALVWDVIGLAEGQTRVIRLTLGQLTACWRSLLSTDAARAHQALRTLAAAPDQAVPFLAEYMFLKKPDPQQVARLLAELDNDDFRVRSQAAKELEKWGEEIESTLRKALKEQRSVEVRRRIQQLLEAIGLPHQKGVPSRLLRWLRVVEVLEWIDNPAARELLEKVAANPPQEEVGQQAKAALKRLRASSNP